MTDGIARGMSLVASSIIFQVGHALTLSGAWWDDVLRLRTDKREGWTSNQ